MRLRKLALATPIMAASAFAAHAMAQSPQDEVAQLRALLRQQAAAMQMMQRNYSPVLAA